MIRKIICISIILAAFTAGHAQKNVSQLFDEFAGMKETTKVDIGRFAMKFAGLFSDTFGVEGIEVIALENSAASVKQRFADAVRNIRDANFETMINSNENGERVKVLVRIRDEVVNEMVVLSTGNSPAMVRIKGKIKKADIEKLVSEHRK